MRLQMNIVNISSVLDFVRLYNLEWQLPATQLVESRRLYICRSFELGKRNNLVKIELQLRKTTSMIKMTRETFINIKLKRANKLRSCIYE